MEGKAGFGAVDLQEIPDPGVGNQRLDHVLRSTYWSKAQQIVIDGTFGEILLEKAGCHFRVNVSAAKLYRHIVVHVDDD